MMEMDELMADAVLERLIGKEIRLSEQFGPLKALASVLK